MTPFKKAGASSEMGTKSHNSIWARGTGGSNERSYKISAGMWRYSQKCKKSDDGHVPKHVNQISLEQFYV